MTVAIACLVSLPDLRAGYGKMRVTRGLRYRCAPRGWNGLYGEGFRLYAHLSIRTTTSPTTHGLERSFVAVHNGVFPPHFSYLSLLEAL